MAATYREYRTKDIAGFSDDKEQVTYTQKKVFYFDQDATGPNLTETDTICTINIPFIVSRNIWCFCVYVCVCVCVCVCVKSIYTTTVDTMLPLRFCELHFVSIRVYSCCHDILLY